MTNHGYNQTNYLYCAARSADARDTVVCPKPRRVRLAHAAVESPHAPPRHMSLHQEECESKVGNELMDIFRGKGGCGPDQSYRYLDSSPPYFSGSPPSRVSNPLIQDVHFVEENFPPNPVVPGCVRANFGNSPAVRVEGFDCLDRDRRNCNIPTFA